jgi:hypothetical protein
MSDTQPSNAPSVPINSGRAKPPRPVPLQGDLQNLPVALDPLKALPNWVCWKFVWKVNKNGAGKWTKPPYRPSNPKQLAKNNDPSTWGTYEQALAEFKAGRCDGIGFCLSGTGFASFDLDKARDAATGEIAPEDMAYVNRAASYSEVSVSGTGVHVIGFGFGPKEHRKQKIPGSTAEIESYRGCERYIVVTGNPLPGSVDAWPHLINIDAEIDAVVSGGKDAGLNSNLALDSLAGSLAAGDIDDASLPDDLIKLIEKGVPPQDDLSAAFHHAVCWLRDHGWSAERIEARITGKPVVPERFAERLGQEIARCLRKAEAKTEAAAAGDGCGVAFGDFFAYMPNHQYIFVPTREMWPANSVNARLSPVPVKKKDGTPALDAKGRPRYARPNTWLDEHRAVEQMTWAPGEPLTIANRLIAEGGWVERPGAATFNNYRPPTVRQGNAAGADRWLDLLQRIYPEDTNHIVKFCAHRIQHPAVKINHALLLGGAPGIGKDTLLEPLKLGVGPWNFREVSPQEIMGGYNDYMRCVVLRISEIRDLGDVNRYAFYEHMKTISASPPDVLRVHGKYIPHHCVVNVAGVIETTNHRFDGIYLPPDDRRTYVAWSEVRKEDFVAGFWPNLWAWYGAGGLENVVAYLAEYDLSKFDPKAPPPQTEAFWQIVGVGAAPEESELADIFDALGVKENARDADGKPCRPVVTTLDKVRSMAQGSLFEWLDDRKNRRVMPHKFERYGYTPVRNETAKGEPPCFNEWKLKSLRATQIP